MYRTIPRDYNMTGDSIYGSVKLRELDIFQVSVQAGLEVFPGYSWKSDPAKAMSTDSKYAPLWCWTVVSSNEKHAESVKSKGHILIETLQKLSQAA
eukprot:g41115.t1